MIALFHQYSAPVQVAFLCVALGKKDDAFEYLEHAFAKNDVWLNVLPIYPHIKPLHNASRFKKLVERMNFPK